MKAIKYFLIGALMTVIGAPAMAQTISLDEAIKVVESNKTVKEKEAALKAAKFNKKDAAAAVRVGNSFLLANDTLNAKKYAQLAVKANKNFGDAYVLLGDIEAYSDNPGEAAMWYQQCIYFDKQNTKGYTRYAAINSYSSPANSVETLNQLRAIKPDYPVDAEAGHIYYNVFVNKGGEDNLKTSINYYKKVSVDKLPEDKLREFALVAYMGQDYDASLKASQYGLSKNNRDAGYNRLSLYDYAAMEKYDEAIPYIDRLFNQSDSVKITDRDYAIAALTYKGAKNFDEALKIYNRQLSEAATNAEKAPVAKNIADCYTELKKYPEAIAAWSEYFDLKGEKTITEENTFAGLYQKYSNTLEGEAKTAALKQAAAIYEGMAKNPNYADNADFCYYKAAQANAMLDPTSDKGLAKPYYEKLAELVENHGVNSSADKARAIEAYSYLGYYFFKNKKNADAKAIYQKLLVVDPENATAKSAVENLK